MGLHELAIRRLLSGKYQRCAAFCPRVRACCCVSQLLTVARDYLRQRRHQTVFMSLLSLVEWADDAELATRAAMMLDLLLVDIALHLHNGNFGATTGRSYIKDKGAAPTQNTFQLSKMLFNQTRLPYQSNREVGATLLARAKKYRIPQVIRRIAAFNEPMTSRQRMNLPLNEKPPADPTTPPPPAPFGLSFEDEKNLAYWWTYSSQALWMMTPLLFKVAEHYDLWPLLSEFEALRALVEVDGYLERTVLQARTIQILVWPVINEALLTEVNTYAYRTSAYALSTAQDYRKGLRGAQTHISQATLSENAIVFTQHPAKAPPEQPPAAGFSWEQFEQSGPGYWTGNGAEPRAVQHANVALYIYAPQYAANGLAALLGGVSYIAETHAYFPVAHFDEVVADDVGSWTFGRKGSGYVALFSLLPTMWRTGGPEVFENQGLPFDLVAKGSASNVWIVEMGSEEQWGSFDSFRTAILGSAVDATPLPDQGGDGMPDGFDVSYSSPSQGLMAFGWHAELVVNGTLIELAAHPRFDNPFIRAAFWGEERANASVAPTFNFTDGSEHLALDFGAAASRSASALWL